MPTQQLFKFLTADRQSPTGNGAYTLNRWRSVRGVLVPCRNGLHATTADNLVPYLNETLWRVEIDGEYVWHDDASMGRKLVARRMRIVQRIEAWDDRTARLFAADCAEHVLPHFEASHPADTRPRTCIEVARRFARGEATADELRIVYRAAYSAAYSAADSAAAAAASGAASSASSSASSGAAYSAADSAASRAASSAADSAADSAASSAAYSIASGADGTASYRAEREWQRRHLCAALNLQWDAEVPS